MDATKDHTVSCLLVGSRRTENEAIETLVYGVHLCLDVSFYLCTGRNVHETLLSLYGGYPCLCLQHPSLLLSFSAG